MNFEKKGFMAELILNVKPRNTRKFGKKYGWDQWSSWAWNWPENQIKKKKNKCKG